MCPLFSLFIFSLNIFLLSPLQGSKNQKSKNQKSKNQELKNQESKNNKLKNVFTSTHMHVVTKNKTKKNTYLWLSGHVNPFNELILSWNALRPSKGFFQFNVSLFYNNSWSPLKPLAEWGENYQKTFGFHGLSPVHHNYVRVDMQKKLLATQFKIEVKALKGAKLDDLDALFVSASCPDLFRKETSVTQLPSISVKGVPAFSQWTGTHPRCKDFCSPTSTSMIVRYFQKSFLDQPISTQLTGKELVAYADQVHDKGLDIYGNWLMNIAHAYQETKGKIFFSVRRLNNFEALHRYLMHKIPVAVSIRGPIAGGALPYDNGHFIVVTGWDRKNKMVQCIDPAFKKISQVRRSYKYDDFVTAWGRSRNLSYVALLKNTLLS